MSKHLTFTSRAVKATFHLLLLAIALRYVHAARILTEEDADPPVLAPAQEESDMAPVAGPATVIPTAVSPLAATTSATTVANENPPPLSFFMHDILGGSSPSARVEAGIIANTQINGLPFTKINGGIFPMNGGVPVVTANNGINNNNGIINNNNLPFLAGLNGGATSTVIQNNGNNNVDASGNTLPFVTPGQLPTGATLQKLMFGTITVIDDELTEGHELGSSVVGRAQGFYLASSLDGSSQTMAFTALFHEGDHTEEDTLSFFGVHRTAAPESQITIVGGTGKYENAKGYATIQTLHPTDQHITDGVETLLQFSVFITAH